MAWCLRFLSAPMKENMMDLGQTFKKITGEMNTASGPHLELLRQTQEKFAAVGNAMQDKSQETDKAFNVSYDTLKVKLYEVEENLRRSAAAEAMTASA